MSIMIFYEGVLRSWNEQPILEGFRLATSLGAGGDRLVMATSDSADKILRDLRTEHLLDLVPVIVDRTLDLPPLPLWQRQIEKVRSWGAVSMVVSSDPLVIEWAVGHGVTGLLFAHPKHGRPPHRPEQGSRSWARLLEELEART